MIRIPDGGTLEDLPSYRRSHHVVDADAQAQLRARLDRYGSAAVCELAGLSKTPAADPAVSFELIRALLHDVWSVGNEQVWFGIIVEAAYRALVGRFGGNTIRSCGPSVAIEHGDERLRESLRLIPCAIHADRFASTMLDELLTTPDEGVRQTLTETLQFVTDGFDVAKLDVPVAEFLAGLAHRRSDD